MNEELSLQEQAAYDMFTHITRNVEVDEITFEKLRKIRVKGDPYKILELVKVLASRPPNRFQFKTRKKGAIAYADALPALEEIIKKMEENKEKVGEAKQEETKEENYSVYYIGSSNSVKNRILDRHVNSDVGYSLLRKHIADKKGYPLEKTFRDGEMRWSIKSNRALEYENEITHYIKGGFWKVYTFAYDFDYRDFEQFLIDKIKPILNTDKKPWQTEESKRYVSFVKALKEAEYLDYEKVKSMKDGEGVYMFFHEEKP